MAGTNAAKHGTQPKNASKHHTAKAGSNATKHNTVLHAREYFTSYTSYMQEDTTAHEDAAHPQRYKDRHDAHRLTP